MGIEIYYNSNYTSDRIVVDIEDLILSHFVEREIKLVEISVLKEELENSDYVEKRKELRESIREVKKELKETEAWLETRRKRPSDLTKSSSGL